MSNITGYFATFLNAKWRAPTDKIIGGQGVLSAAGGIATVYTPSVKEDSVILLSHADAVGSGALFVDPALIVPGVSFIVKSSGGGGNTDKFNWFIANHD